jgi:hypothetical protein
MKEIREKRREAKKSLKGMRRVLDFLDKCLDSGNPHHIEVASAFFHMLKHHLEDGDLMPENIQLAALLRAMKDD